MTKPEYIFQIITLVIASLAILISLRSNYLAKKSYKLSKQDFKNRQSNFKIYLNDSYTLTIDSSRFVLIHLSITNQSDSKNSFKTRLKISYHLSHDEMTTVYFDHLPKKAKDIPKSDLTFFKENINLAEKENLTNWLIFETPKSLHFDHKIIKNIILVEDLKGKIKKIETQLLKELIHGNR